MGRATEFMHLANSKDTNQSKYSHIDVAKAKKAIAGSKKKEVKSE